MGDEGWTGCASGVCAFVDALERGGGRADVFIRARRAEDGEGALGAWAERRYVGE
jgi:hypothetical protein